MIPLSVPHLAGNEWKYIQDCLDTNWVSSVGAYVNRFEKEIAAYCGVKYAVATSNGTAALHLALLLAGVQAGEYVVVPDITFVASLNAIRYLNAEPLLLDIDTQYWQADLTLLQNWLEENAEKGAQGTFYKKTGKKIAAFMPVHILGNVGDMDAWLELSEKWNIPLIEDATESLGSTYKGKAAGSFGLMGCLSFNGNKVMTTGGGGMLLTNDATLAQKAKHLSTQAKSDKIEYIHDEVGYNYRLVNILAAMGVAQLEQLPSFLEEKQRIAQTYKQALSGIEGVRFQEILPQVSYNQWLFTLCLPNRKAVMEHLLSQKIECRPLWQPMHLLEMYKDCTFITESKNSERLYEQALSIPCSVSLSQEEQTFVINAMLEVLIRS